VYPKLLFPVKDQFVYAFAQPLQPFAKLFNDVVLSNVFLIVFSLCNSISTGQITNGRHPVLLLMLEIIARLPTKCAGRLRCVCRMWLSYLTTDEFAKANCRYISTSLELKILSIGHRATSLHAFGYARNSCWL
jgi:hypothetical protein